MVQTNYLSTDVLKLIFRVNFKEFPNLLSLILFATKTDQRILIFPIRSEIFCMAKNEIGSEFKFGINRKQIFLWSLTGLNLKKFLQKMVFIKCENPPMETEKSDAKFYFLFNCECLQRKWLH